MAKQTKPKAKKKMTMLEKRKAMIKKKTKQGRPAGVPKKKKM